MKTIKELAEEIGVSKTAIRKKAEALGILKDFIKEGNKSIVTEEQEKKIKEAFQNENQQPKPKTENKMLPDNTLFLMAQLTAKDKQIEELNNRIKELNIINAGLLQTLQNEQEQIKQLTTKTETENENQQPKKKRGFFARLFNLDE